MQEHVSSWSPLSMAVHRRRTQNAPFTISSRALILSAWVHSFASLSSHRRRRSSTAIRLNSCRLALQIGRGDRYTIPRPVPVWRRLRFADSAARRLSSVTKTVNIITITVHTTIPVFCMSPPMGNECVWCSSVIVRFRFMVVCYRVSSCPRF